MKNFMVLTQMYPPESSAGARRVGAMVAALSHQFQVQVITLEPSYPSPELFDASRYKSEDLAIDNPKITRVFMFRPHTPSLLVRALRECYMALRLGLAARGQPAEALLVSTPSPFLIFPAFTLAVLRRIPLVWDLRDLTWRYGAESAPSGWLGALLMGWFETIMIFLIRRTEVVVAATQGITDILIQEYRLEPARIITLYNGVSRAFFEEFEEPQILAEGRPLVLYLGLLGYNHGIEVLADVARELPEVDFLVVGDGSQRYVLEQRLEKYNLENVRLEGYTTSQEAIQGYYQQADILFNHTRDLPVLNKTVVSAKLFEYMATGRPIVYAGRGLAVQFLGEAGCAEIAEPEDPASIAAAITTLVDNPTHARRLGIRGREFIRSNYLRENLIGDFAQDLRRLLDGVL